MPEMSSSSESEDDEESKRISQAIIPGDLLAALAPIKPEVLSSTHSHESESEKAKPSLGIQLKGTQRNDLIVPLKSKRSDKSQEEDLSHHSYALKTTPEFRAHIGKHLMKLLDRQIEEDLKESVWKKPDVSKMRKPRGIKLFYNASTLCLGETSPALKDSNVPQKPTKIRPRKHRLSSGSESSESEEDKINACVFSVEDINFENRMLEDLSKSGVEVSVPEPKPGDGDGDQVGLKGEKKKKKRKHCVETDCGLERSQSVNASEEANSEITNSKKKKKKKNKKNKKLSSDAGVS